MARCADPNANDATAPIEVDRYGLADVRGNRGNPLGELWRGEAIARESQLIQPLKLFSLVGLEPFEIAVNGVGHV